MIFEAESGLSDLLDFVATAWRRRCVLLCSPICPIFRPFVFVPSLRVRSERLLLLMLLLSSSLSFVVVAGDGDGGSTTAPPLPCASRAGGVECSPPASRLGRRSTKTVRHRKPAVWDVCTGRGILSV
ncbi:unnamed protein product [Pylaiella littoralis]